MSPFQRHELFHEPGPEDALEYLWGRLQDRDLSPEEALALLSAVHQKLSESRLDPKLYFSYSRFMESLSRDMPVVHDAVVARWIESRRKGRRERRAGRAWEGADQAADEGPLDELQPIPAVPEARGSEPSR